VRKRWHRLGYEWQAGGARDDDELDDDSREEVTRP
jgi:hypothetical protein